tara:strand:- start:20617 stop:21711 length:1095 start_codon:yes stop_codon:yes gene_type:complete
MAGNAFGKSFTLTTFGESHGPALGCIVDGCPAGLAISEQDIQLDLDKRRPGQSRYTTQRRETDKVEILSGVFEGKTTGAPIALVIKNQDQRAQDYQKIKDAFRPGHGDYTYFKKYGFRDWRGGGRQSARETVARVAAGAIARKFLAHHKIKIIGFISQIGNIVADSGQYDMAEISQNPFFCPDKKIVPLLETYIQQILKAGDSVGAKVQVQAIGVPVGLGEPVFERLDARLAHALMSINAAKAVEIGDGINVVEQKGSEHRDEMILEAETKKPKFLSNHAGGILAGIASGQDIVASVSFKPTSSIRMPGQSLNEHGQQIEVVTTGRHDPCVGIRAVPICEAMMAIVLADCWLTCYGNQPIRYKT